MKINFFVNYIQQTFFFLFFLQLENRLKHFGVDKLENLKLVEDLENARQNRGFAFLCFSSYLDAMNAYKRLQMRDVDLGADRSAKVAFAFPEPWNRQNVSCWINVFWRFLFYFSFFHMYA